jgi:hypothetical protein
MKRIMFAIAGGAAALALAVPAAAQNGSWSSHSRSGDFVGRPAGFGSGHDGFRNDRRNRRNADASVIMDWYGGEWALYNNRSWAPDSYNDWWHDNPSRAYPAWMQRNQDCSRKWFAGDTLTC